MQGYDLVAHLERQRAFSRATFGPGPRTKMVVDHIRKECGEIEGAPYDLKEWIDVVLLALDGAWRCAEAMGVPRDHVPTVIADELAAKQLTNEFRDWPDWRTADPDKAIEHVRPVEAPAPRCGRCDGDRFISVHANLPDEPCPACNAGAASGAERVARAASRPIVCPKAKAGVPRRPCLFPQCDCDAR